MDALSTSGSPLGVGDRRKRVLIVQNKLMHYREPLFAALGEVYALTVAHSGAGFRSGACNYAELVLPQTRWGPFHLQRGLLRHLRSDAFDVIIVMFDLRWPLGLLPAFLKKSYRYVLWGHRYSERKGANLARNALMHRADGNILYGEADVARMLSSGISPATIYVAHNTIHVPNSDNCSNAPKKSLLFVGRAQARKRVDLLIDAFAEIIKEVPRDVVVEIVGSGEENETLRKLALIRGVSERVIFRGEITAPEALKDCFSRAFAYVSPGHVGLGVLHSFAYGVPVITAAHAQHAQEAENLQEGVNSLLFGDPQDLRLCLSRIVRDSELARSLGSNAYRLYVERRTMSAMVQTFISAIEGG